MRFIILLFSLSFLSGCVIGSLDQLSFLDPQANDFPTALAAEYLAYAKAEKEQGHPLLAEHFASKGMRAWRGDLVTPEAVSPDTVSPLKEQMQSTRTLLVALLTDDVKRVVPQPSARAQLLFDCWVIQSERKNDTQLCTSELDQAMTTLENVASTLSLTSETTHILSFVPGRATLSTQSKRDIDTIAGEVAGGLPYTVELEGVAQTARARNLLALRVTEIKKALKSRGIGEEHIRLNEIRSEKTVYLSCDDTIKDADKISVTISIFGQPHSTTEQNKP